MKPPINITTSLVNTRPYWQYCWRLFVALGLLAVLPMAQAVTPAPDGGYPGGNTAEGQAALSSLTTGTYNTAVGFLSLRTNTEGSFNTATGAGALLANDGDPTAGEGIENTATGAGALLSNTTGNDNTANGAFALFSNTTGVANTAMGNQALNQNSEGIFNTATGAGALFNNTTGNGNTATGEDALVQNSSGQNNTALGAEAGQSLTTGSGNVFLGAGMDAIAGDEMDHTYIRNVNTTSVSGGSSDSVTVDLTTGLLGHASSSRRYKEDIKPMNDASEALYRLKPVSYRYKKQIDPIQSTAFGLIAEEVAEVNFNLVARNSQGRPESVHYEMVNAMLLNEFLKEHCKVQRLEATVAALATQLKEQVAQIQKVSAQLEMNKSPGKMVLNNH